jgi:hypothetical protein
MKVTSQEALRALIAARGDQSWSQYAASAPRTSDGKILLPRLGKATGAEKRSPNSFNRIE